MSEGRGAPGGAQYAVVTVDARFERFADLREELERLRDAESPRVIVLDLRTAGFHAKDDPGVLEHFATPLVAVWEGELDESRLAAGVFCDIRVGHSGQRLTWAPSMPGRGRRRLATVLGVKPDDIMTALAHGMLESGIVTVVAEEDALAEGERVASLVASRGPIATELAKEAVWRGLELPFAHALRFETDLTLILQTTNDRAEGVLAFLEKREPEFTGT